MVIEWRMVEGQDDIIGFALLHGTLHLYHGLLTGIGLNRFHIFFKSLTKLRLSWRTCYIDDILCRTVAPEIHQTFLKKVAEL